MRKSTSICGVTMELSVAEGMKMLGPEFLTELFASTGPVTAVDALVGFASGSIEGAATLLLFTISGVKIFADDAML
jgi:hypothetical protein